MRKTLSLALVPLLLFFCAMGCTPGAASEPPPATASGPVVKAPDASGGPGVPVNPDYPHMPDISEMEPVHVAVSAMAVGQSTNIMTNNLVTEMLKCLPKGSTMHVSTDNIGSATAPYLISNGTAQFVMGEACPTSWAIDGITPGMEGQYAQNVMSIGGGAAHSRVQVVFSEAFVKKTGYTTIEQVLADQYPAIFACKPNNSFGEMTLRMILAANGVTYDDVRSWGGDVLTIDQAQALSMVKDGRADITADHSPVTNANFTELNLTSDCLNVQLGEKTLEYLYDIGFATEIIPKNAYREGQPAADIKTGSCGSTYMISAELSNEVAYLMTYAFMENLDALIEINANFETMDPAVAWQNVYLGAPLHPGAKLYYQDAGYMPKD